MTDAELKFGDYVLIEQHRYGADNEMYEHKVIQPLSSNTFVDVPVTGSIKEIQHVGVVPVVRCICCGVDESRAFKYRVQDVELKP